MQDAALVERHDAKGKRRAECRVKSANVARHGVDNTGRRQPVKGRCDPERGDTFARDPLNARHEVEEEGRLLVVDVLVGDGPSQDLLPEMSVLALVVDQRNVAKLEAQSKDPKQQCA